MAIGISEAFRISNGLAVPMFKVVVAGCIVFTLKVGKLLHHYILQETAETPQHIDRHENQKSRGLSFCCSPSALSAHYSLMRGWLGGWTTEP
jgi:hypothetical protein